MSPRDLLPDQGGSRWLVVVLEVEGVIKEDVFVGPYRSRRLADRKAASIERASCGLLQARVEPLDPGTTSARDVIASWGPRMVDKVREWRDAGDRVRPDGSAAFDETGQSHG